VPRAENELSPVLAGFSVPKKKFHSSVSRHRVRRLMSEAWRLSKQGLYPCVPEDRQLHLFLIFTDAAMPDHLKVKEAITNGIERLKKELAKTE